MIEFITVLVWKLVGALIGYVIPWLDVVGYVMYLHPDDPETAHVRESLRAKKFFLAMKDIVLLLGKPLRFMHRSVYFIAAFLALGVFTITSTGSVVGKGVVAGLGVHMVLAMIPFRTSIHEIRTRFFWGLADTVSERALQTLIGAIMLIVVIAFAT